MTATPSDVADAFLRPRPARHDTDALLLDRLSHATLELPGGALNYWRTGTSTGCAVLLLHGWEGSAADLTPFAAPLLHSGHEAIFVELPAHGRSAMSWTSIPHAAHALTLLGTALGPLRGVIAHSVGGAVATLAMARGLDVDRAVLIGTPARYIAYARAFARFAGLDHIQTEQMLQHLRLRYGIDTQAVSTPDAASLLAQEALVIHSADDSVVPLSDAEMIAAAWPAARLMRCNGLGHQRILSNEDVVAAAVSFVSAAQTAITGS
jgi:pimeloyl-ACP methyl ester carboxylesterase